MNDKMHIFQLLWKYALLSHQGLTMVEIKASAS